MMLIIDFTNEHHRICLLEGRTAKWFDEGASTGRYNLLSRVTKYCDRVEKYPRAIAVTLRVRNQKVEPQTHNVSWSTIRAAVAMANTLAFAWNVKVVEVPVSGAETEKELIAAAKAAAEGGKKKVWVKAKYSGEPTITKAKVRV